MEAAGTVGIVEVVLGGDNPLTELVSLWQDRMTAPIRLNGYF